MGGRLAIVGRVSQQAAGTDGRVRAALQGEQPKGAPPARRPGGRGRAAGGLVSVVLRLVGPADAEGAPVAEVAQADVPMRAREARLSGCRSHSARQWSRMRVALLVVLV